MIRVNVVCIPFVCYLVGVIEFYREIEKTKKYCRGKIGVNGEK